MIRKCGLKRLHTLIFNAVLVITYVVLTNSIYSESHSNTLMYKGDHHKYPITVTYTQSIVDGSVLFQSNIDTEKIKETNTTIISNNQLISVIQESHNDIDGEYFKWMVSKKGAHYNIYFNNIMFSEEFKAKISFKKHPHTLQSLLYLLQQSDIELNKKFHAKLLVPWKQIFPISLTVKAIDQLMINGKSIDAYQLKIELDVFFGKVLPKTTIWVQKESPHILLKYKGFNKNYQLVSK